MKAVKPARKANEPVQPKPLAAKPAPMVKLTAGVKPAMKPVVPEYLSNRPDWATYFIRIAQFVATRSTCLRRRVGAVIVRENRILASGYNGAPSSLRHCYEVPGGCLREARNIPSGERQELCRGLHAEQNAILQAAAFGVSLKGSEIYVTHQPCVTCAKMLMNAGIERVRFLGDYPDSLSLEMLEEGKIHLERIQLDKRHVQDND